MDHKKKSANEQFIKQLDIIIKKNITKYKPVKVFIFGPKYMKKQLEFLIPKEYNYQLVKYIEGNYQRFNPVETLSVLNENLNSILEKNIRIAESRDDISYQQIMDELNINYNILRFRKKV